MQEKAGQFQACVWGFPPPRCLCTILSTHPGTPGQLRAVGTGADRGAHSPTAGGGAGAPGRGPGGRSGKSPGRPGKHAGGHPGRTGEDHHCPDPGEGNRSIPGRKTPGYRTRGGFLARIKDTAGGIEVAAHERAQVTLQTARAQAAEIRAEGPAGYGTSSPSRQQLQRDLHDAIVSAETELDEVRTAFHRAQAHMEGVQDALSHLVSGTEETEKTIRDRIPPGRNFPPRHFFCMLCEKWMQRWRGPLRIYQ